MLQVMSPIGCTNPFDTVTAGDPQTYTVCSTFNGGHSYGTVGSLWRKDGWLVQTLFCYRCACRAEVQVRPVSADDEVDEETERKLERAEAEMRAGRVVKGSEVRARARRRSKK